MSEEMGPLPPNLRRRKRFQLRRRRYLPQAASAEVGENRPAGTPGESGGADAAAEIERLGARLLRLQADHENYRKRVAREREEQTAFALAKIMRELLVVLDNFERAMDHRTRTPEVDAFAQGLELTHKQLRDVLTRFGLEPIPAQGQRFDPHLHEALATEEVAGVDEGTILDVLQQGYTLHGRVLRPALVKVAKAPAEATP